MSGALAIIAGTGALPQRLAQHCRETRSPYHVVVFDGIDLDWLSGEPVIPALFEKPGRLFADLRAAGCNRLVFAGSMTRPALNPLRFDRKMLSLAPKVFAALRSGDDNMLRAFARIIEQEGLIMVAPHELLDDLLVEAGCLTRDKPCAADRADALRARQIAVALGSVDVGQAVVVAHGLCLGIETIQGTDALLDFATRTGPPHRKPNASPSGILYKSAKPDQDMRLDMATIGPGTVRGVVAAGLRGIVLRAGAAQILERRATIAEAEAAGVFIWAIDETQQ